MPRKVFSALDRPSCNDSNMALADEKSGLRLSRRRVGELGVRQRLTDATEPLPGAHPLRENPHCIAGSAALAILGVGPKWKPFVWGQGQCGYVVRSPESRSIPTKLGPSIKTVNSEFAGQRSGGIQSSSNSCGMPPSALPMPGNSTTRIASRDEHPDTLARSLMFMPTVEFEDNRVDSRFTRNCSCINQIPATCCDFVYQFTRRLWDARLCNCSRSRVKL